jgi:hypothetical protein
MNQNISTIVKSLRIKIMSEAELPQDPAQLQALARQQAKELNELRGQLNVSDTEKISVSIRVYVW